MNNTKQKSIAYSFNQLINITRKKYFSEKDVGKKEEIANIFICDPDVSFDVLNRYYDLYIKQSYDISTIYDCLENFYGILQYSLPSEKNIKFFELMKRINPKNINKSYEYLATKNPINNFKDIYAKYSLFLNLYKNKMPKEQILNILTNIYDYIDEMLKVYNTNLGEYYFPPMKEYPIYAYNFYSFLFYKTLKKFKTKTITQPFKNNKNLSPTYTDDEWIKINYQIALFFDAVHLIFEKFNEKNISKDLMALKIIFFFFKCCEHTRKFILGIKFWKYINCIYCEPISSDILNRFEFYRENEDIPLKKEDWDSIRINEILYVKFPEEASVKIKHFKNDILSLDDNLLLTVLKSHDIDNLNIDGLVQSSFIKYNEYIENYSKKLLKKIFSSKIYINNFLKHDKRFNSQNKEKKELLESIFQGENSKEIFEEIWNNIFFLPFIDTELAGFNSRNQYSIFINPKYQYEDNLTFQKIIPRYHCEINALYHEFTHNIVLLLAANLENNDFETVLIDEDNYLINLQNIYSEIYKQHNKKYDKFDDFGDLMEVELYGIRPRKFRTFSGLFCLNPDSYELDSDTFKEICVGLYNYDEDNKSEEKNINKKYNFGEIMQNLLNSEIAELLKKYFIFDSKNRNETFTEDGKPRHYNDNFLINEEYSINTDYCDKLDNL